MRAWDLRSTLLFTLIPILTACGGGGEGTDDGPCEAGDCTLTVVSGDAQSAAPRQALLQPFVVRIDDAKAAPVPMRTVKWRVTKGGGSITPESSVTDATGQTSATLTVGQVAGTGSEEVEVTVDGIDGLSVTLTASVLAGPAATITMISGDGQRAPVHTALAAPLVIEVTDAFDNTVPNVNVAWSTTAGGGSLVPSAPQTDAAGRAEAVATVGDAAGVDNNLFTASVGGVALPARFIASAEVGPAAFVAIVSGDRQGGTRSRPLPEPFVVRVVDAYTNPITGATVTFSAGTSGGSITPEIATTDATGSAAAEATLGPSSGVQEFLATVDGLATPARLTATAFPPICSSSRWCWYSPLPQGNDLRAAHAVSSTEVWVVGEHGTTLRWNGGAWEGLASGTTVQLSGVFGAAPDAVFAVGAAGTVLRWNGFAWAAENVGLELDLYAIWGTSATDLWAVGVDGTALHYDGITWLPSTTGSTAELSAVWGASTSDVWAAGDRGALLRWDGMAWATIDTGVTEDLHAIWGSSASNVFIVGDRARILRWDGTALSTPSSPINTPLWSIAGGAANEAFAAGERGAVLRWNGTRWASSPSRTNNTIFGLARYDDGDGYLGVGEAGITMRPSSGEWLPEAANFPRELQGLWGLSATELWAVGSRYTILRWDGVQWVEQPEVVRAQFYAISGTAPNDAWAVGSSGTTVRWDGTEWRPSVTATPQDLFAVHARTSTDAWAVGDAGTIVHWDGTSWSTSESNTTVRLYGVWAASGSEVWAVGDTGTILRFDGRTWSAFTSPTMNYLLAVRGQRARDDVWATGTSGTLLHFDGEAWTEQPSGTEHALYSVYSPSRSFAIASGEAGAIVRWDGQGWSAEESGTENLLYGIWGASPDELWAVGTKRTILRWTPD